MYSTHYLIKTIINILFYNEFGLNIITINSKLELYVCDMNIIWDTSSPENVIEI